MENRLSKRAGDFFVSLCKWSFNISGYHMHMHFCKRYVYGNFYFADRFLARMK